MSEGDLEKLVRNTHSCTTCRSTGHPVTVTPGSFIIELGLWLFFFIPGLFYSLWRLAGRRKDACPYCDGKMVNKGTGIGSQIAAEEMARFYANQDSHK